MNAIELLSRIAQPGEGKIVLLVLDGLGDLRTRNQPRTALEAARIPNFDALAAGGALGRIVPVAPGVTPGSGPGHLALFGYDPTSEQADIGRGALEALGVGIDFRPGDVVARGNFATFDADGRVSDRRAGRLSTEESRRIVTGLDRALEAARGEGRLGDLRVTVHPGEGYRFVLLVEGPDLSPTIADTDPQEVGERAISLEPRDPEDPRARRTVERLEPALRAMAEALRGEPRANGFLLRGFATLPRLPTLPELYGLAPGCFAGYPLYRGASRLAGMEVVDSGQAFGEQVEGVRRRWRDFDFFFLHVKDTDRAGEDGDLAAKARALEEVDGVLPGLLALMDEERDVIAVTGDHSTPAPMRAHSWHPVPLLLGGPFCFADDETAFTEVAASRGHLGTLLSRELMGLLLANAGRLAKFGA